MSVFVKRKGFEDSYDRFDPLTETCPINGYRGFFDGFFIRCRDTFLFVNILQFALVTLMYWNIGKGKYWKILFYGSVAGCIASILESGTVAFICRESTKGKTYSNVFTFFVAEFFWICNEYSIPLLNLVKMKAFTNGKASKIVNHTVLTIFPLFAICRFWIGYVRSKFSVIKMDDIDNTHGVTFALMAIADLVCTISIIYYVRKHNKQELIKTSNITHYIERSSYAILVCVDAVSIILAVLCFIPTYFSSVPKSIPLPLHCIKCAFLLILATDALLFKYEANTSSVQSSESYKYKNSYDTYNYNKSRNNFSMETSNHSIKSFGHYGFPNDNSSYQRSIIKNYTTKPAPISVLNDSSNDNNTIQSFGFLYQQPQNFN